MKIIIYTIAFVLIVQTIFINETCIAQNNTSGTSGSKNYHSKTLGGKWKQTELNNKTVRSLAISGNNIYAVTQGSGIFLSTNNGTNWTNIGLDKDVLSLVIKENFIFAGTEKGVYLSTNNGATWKQTDLDNEIVMSLAISGNNVFAGTYEDNGVYLSTNNGTTWMQTELNNKSVWSIAISGNNIFAGTDPNGVYLSANNGTTWMQTELNNINVMSLVLSGNNIFAGTEGSGVYLSTNNGITWRQTELNNKIIRSLAINGNNIFAGTQGSGVFLSTNKGDNWTINGLNGKSILSLAINGDYIFAGTFENGVYFTKISSVSNDDLEKFKEKAEIYRNLDPKPEISEDVRKYVIQATALTKNKKYEEALDLYKKIFELDEIFPDAHFNVALLHAQVEDYESAILEMKKYLMLVPDATDARAAQDKIYEWEILNK